MTTAIKTYSKNGKNVHQCINSREENHNENRIIISLSQIIYIADQSVDLLLNSSWFLDR